MRNKNKNKGRGTIRFRIYDCTFQMIKRMSLEEQGRLLEHICRYVEEGNNRDKSGDAPMDALTCEEEDNIGVRIIFDEWKDHYDHDEEEYDRVSRNRSMAGQKGMQKRWHSTVTDDNNVTTDDNNVITDNNNVIIDDNNVMSSDNNVMKNITDVITVTRKKSNQKKEYNNLKKETSPYGESKKKISLSLSRTPERQMQVFPPKQTTYCHGHGPPVKIPLSRISPTRSPVSGG